VQAMREVFVERDGGRCVDVNSTAFALIWKEN